MTFRRKSLKRCMKRFDASPNGNAQVLIDGKPIVRVMSDGEFINLLTVDPDEKSISWLSGNPNDLPDNR